MEILYTYSSIALAIVGIILFGRLEPKIKPLAFCYAFMVLADIVISYIIIDKTGKLYRALYCIQKPIEYCIFVYTFDKSISKDYKLYLWITVILLFIFGIYQLIFNINDISAATDVILIYSVLSIILALLFFNYVLVSKIVFDPLKSSLFWVATGLLFYYCGNVFSTGFYHRIYNYSKSAAFALYYLNYILGIVQMCLFCLAYIISYRKAL